MDALSVSPSEAGALLALEDFSPEQVAKICRTFLQRLLLGSSNAGTDEKIAQTMDAVGSLLLQTATTNSSAEQLRALLAEVSLSATLAESVAAFYTQHRDTLREHLQRVGISFAQVVGVDWRLDYAVRSKSAGRENVPLFHVALVVALPSGAMDRVSFVASLEEMQDLLAKVRDATKQVERVLASGDE